MPNNLEVSLKVRAQTEGKKDVDALNTSLSTLGHDATLGALESEIAELTSELNKSGVAAKGTEEKLAGIGAAAENAAARSVPAARRIGEGVESISVKLSDLQKAVLAYLGVTNFVPMLEGVGATADAYKNLSARIRLVTGDGAAFDAALTGVERVATQTNSVLESTADLFARVYAAGKNLKMSQDQALALTQTINQAIQVSGASAESADAATTQLIQGLQSGVLRGDEFNSVMEQSPRLAKAMANGLGITVGKLRELANAGGLTTQVVLQALESQGATIESEYAKMPETIGRAMTNLRNHWTVFIGETDKGTGASATAAKAINALAENLNTLAETVKDAGSAWLAYRAWHMADEFLLISKAAQAAALAKLKDTAETVANTAATAANTVAQRENAIARDVSAARAANMSGGISKLAGALSLVKGLTIAGLLTNLPDIGKWVGESIAKLQGYGKQLQDNEMRIHAHEDATRAMAQATAELAAKQRMAADAALGLNDQSQKLIASFEADQKAGKAAAEAIDELSKALQLGDIHGISNAGAALDALAQRGELRADQVRQAWTKALQGQDLQVFLTQANAAFDGSAQGARRMASATEAAISEALRRTGKDTLELTTGVGAAAQSAINDVDVLTGHLDELKARGINVGEALSGSLDKATDAAKTDDAIDAVIERFQKLGDQGLLTGDKLREGLEKAQRKAEDLKAGINDLDEAFRQLGMRAPTELKDAADKAKQAFDTIKTSGKASAADLREAFKRYAEAVIAANGGVASDALKAQAAMNGLKIDADSAGKSIVSIDPTSLSEVAENARQAANQLGNAQRAADGLNSSMKNGNGGPSSGRGQSASGGSSDYTPKPSGGSGSGSSGADKGDMTVAEMKDAGMTMREIEDYQLNRKPEQQRDGYKNRYVSTWTMQNEDIGRAAGVGEKDLARFSEAFGPQLKESMKRIHTNMSIGSPTEYRNTWNSLFLDAVNKAKQTAEYRAPEPVKRYQVDLTLPGGRSTTVYTASQRDAETLIKQLSGSKRSAL